MDADTAAAVKARAMFAQRLRKADYEKLMQQSTVQDAAAVLDHDTAFHETMKKGYDPSIHRAALEQLLRQDLYSRFAKLTLYAGESSGQMVYGALLSREVEEIMQYVDTLHDAHHLKEEIPAWALEHASFDIRALQKAKTSAEVLDVLRNSVYYEAVRKALLDPEQWNPTALENELKDLRMRQLLQTAETSMHGEGAAQMKRLLMSDIELQDLTLIYRAYHYFSMTQQEAMRGLEDHADLYPRAQYRRLRSLASDTEVIAYLKQNYARYLSEEPQDIEHMARTIRCSLNCTMMEFSEAPAVVLLAYMNFAQIEIANVISVVEGVRYKAAPEEIRRMIVYRKGDN